MTESDHQGMVFTPNSVPQWLAFVSEAPELLYSGHLGSAKTRTLCEKADFRARSFPDARVVIGRRFRAHLGTTTIPAFREKVVSAAEWAVGWKQAADGGSRFIYPNGSEILFVGFDYAQALLSAEFDLILIEQAEELTEQQWDFAASRLRRQTRRVEPDGTVTYAAHQIAGFCNPSSPGHFLFRRFRPDRGTHLVSSTEPLKLLNGRTVPVGTPIRETVVAGMKDNVENLPDSYLARLQRFTGPMRRRMVMGEWIAFEGAVYPMWDPAVHVVARPTSWEQWGGYPPPTWERVRAFDFGYHPDPFVGLWLTRGPNQRWYVYRQLYMTQRIVREHARTILEHETRELAALQKAAPRLGHDVPRYLNLIESVCDHDNENAAVLDAEGVTVRHARKEIVPGIQTVSELLTPHEIGGHQVCGLYVVRDSLIELDVRRHEAGLPTCLEDEMAVYRWPSNPDPDKPSKEVPVDQHNHAMDCIRYATHSIAATAQGVAMR